MVLAGFGTSLSVSAQGPGQLALPAEQQQVRRLTVNDAVRLAAENNLGIQIARYDPQIQDLSIAQARASYVPSLSSTLRSSSRTQPNRDFLSGAVTASDDTFVTNTGIAATLPWGGSYDVGLNSSRFQSNNFSSTFNPSLQSSLTARVTQPLFRNFKIDGIRQQLQVSQKNREIADVQLRESLTSLSRNVRNAYWNLAYQIASLEVARQSLALAEESLRNTRARIEIGTIPPIDEIADQAEVAQREEAVIVAEAQIATSDFSVVGLLL
jgi:outer membrane protein TolC